MLCLRPKLILAALALFGLGIAGCQTQNIPGPTPIPTELPTLSPSPSATIAPSASAEPPTLRPMVMATALVTAAPVVQAPQPTSTKEPVCFVAQPNDTLISLAQRGGYNDLSVLPAIREMNGLCPTCNNIQAGQKYCIPNPTATPTPQGGEKTATARASELPALATQVFGVCTYTVKSGDTSIGVQLNTGATLRQLCELNDPTTFNCGGCNVDKPIGEQGCRPPLREGQALKVPCAPPTATITPTLTGSETATPTPIFTAPRIISPVNGASVRGIVQLLWLPVSILQPDEFYLVVWTDTTTGQTRQARTQSASFRMPVELEPSGGQAHTVNWQIAVAREAPDSTYVLVSPLSLIYTFRWESR